jgi:hypothetical protein
VIGDEDRSPGAGPTDETSSAARATTGPSGSKGTSCVCATSRGITTSLCCSAGPASASTCATYCSVFEGTRRRPTRPRAPQ